MSGRDRIVAGYAIAGAGRSSRKMPFITPGRLFITTFDLAHTFLNGAYSGFLTLGTHTDEAEQLHVVTENAPVVLFAFDRHGVVTLNQGAGLASLGMIAGEVVGKSVWEVCENDPTLLDNCRRALAGETLTARVRIKNATFDTRYVPVFEDGAVASVIGVATDVTELVQAHAEQRAAEEAQKRFADELVRERELLQALMDNLPDTIYFKDRESRFLRINQALADLFGLDTPTRAIGMTDSDFFSPEHAGSALQDEQDILQSGRAIMGRVEKEVRRNGEERWVLTTKMPLFDGQGQTIGTFGISRDVSAMKDVEDALTHQALHDGLTGLPNRTLLRDRLQAELLRAGEAKSRLALFFLDLNRFKDINDTFGHHSGDAVLQTLGTRLLQLVGDRGTAARLGGDELAVLLPNSDERCAIEWADRILAVLTEPFDLDGQIFDVGSSIGIALYPDHGEDSAVLMRHADIAMYAAKRGRESYVLYSPTLEHVNPARIALTRELRAAISSNQLVLHYQPQVHLESQCAEHLEALVRWNHPERGFLSPDTFIPVAEESGLIRPLTAWVLNEAIRQIAIWKEVGRDIRIAVNLSARSLHDPDIVDTVSSCLERWSVHPSNIALEITESAFIVDPDRALDTATRLHNLGIRLSIDDFGTGYSSLAYLKRLPIDEVKIDRSFVIDAGLNADSAFIVRSVIDLAHNLGIQVVAEGVEDEAVLHSLMDHDCELAQGYYISRPLTADAVLPWLDGREH